MMWMEILEIQVFSYCTVDAVEMSKACGLHLWIYRPKIDMTGPSHSMAARQTHHSSYANL